MTLQPDRQPESKPLRFAIVPVDQCGVRRTAVEYCLYAYRRVEKARHCLTKAEDRDLPAFLAWFQLEFALEFCKLLMLKTRSHYYQKLLNRIGDLVIFERLPYEVAHEIAVAEEKREGGRRPLDKNLFVKELFGLKNSAPGAVAAKERVPRLCAAEEIEKRLRHCYRALARELHPDLNPGSRHRHMWNEAQIAFKTKNLDRLELIYAVTKAAVGVIPTDVGVATLGETTRELHRQWLTLDADVIQKARTPVWNFSERMQCHQTLAIIREKVYVDSRVQIKRYEEEVAALGKQLGKLRRSAKPISRALPVQLTFEFS